MIVDTNNDESLGFDPFKLWIDKIILFMRKRLKYSPEYKLITHRMILNLQREYMSLQASGYAAADIVSGSGDLVKWSKQTYKMSRKISDSLNVSQLFVLNFFLALYNLAKVGKIPYQKWNPKGYIKAKKKQKKIETERSPFEKAAKGLSIIVPLAIVGGIAAGVFILKGKI